MKVQTPIITLFFETPFTLLNKINEIFIVDEEEEDDQTRTLSHLSIHIPSTSFNITSPFSTPKNTGVGDHLLTFMPQKHKSGSITPPPMEQKEDENGVEVEMGLKKEISPNDISSSFSPPDIDKMVEETPNGCGEHHSSSNKLKRRRRDADFMMEEEEEEEVKKVRT